MEGCNIWIAFGTGCFVGFFAGMTFVGIVMVAKIERYNREHGIKNPQI